MFSLNYQNPRSKRVQSKTFWSAHYIHHSVKRFWFLQLFFFSLWRTNSCIGQHNHRSFLAAISVFIVTGLWGIYLSFLTVCTSRDGSVLYMDCSKVYSDSRWDSIISYHVSYVTVTITCCHFCNLVTIGLVKFDLHRVSLMCTNPKSWNLNLRLFSYRNFFPEFWIILATYKITLIYTEENLNIIVHQHRKIPQRK